MLPLIQYSGAKDWENHVSDRRFLRSLVPFIGPPSHLIVRLRLPLAYVLIITLAADLYEYYAGVEIDPKWVGGNEQMPTLHSNVGFCALRSPRSTLTHTVICPPPCPLTL